MCSDIHQSLGKYLRPLGPEIYVGCSNGQLLRFGLRADSPDKVSFRKWRSPRLIDRSPDRNAFHPWHASVAYPKTHRRDCAPAMCRTYFGPVRSASRNSLGSLPILRVSFNPGGQLHFFTLPELDILPILPIRNVQAVTVDQQAFARPFLHAQIHTVEAVDFCVIKKTGLGLFSLREKLVSHKVINIQPQPSNMLSRFNRRSRWQMVDPAHVERGLCFVSPTEIISISSTSGEGPCCP